MLSTYECNMCRTYLADIEHGPPQIIHMFAEVSSCCVTGIFKLFNQTVQCSFSAWRGRFHDLLWNPVLFIKNKRLFIPSDVFSALEKKALICSKRAMLPWVWQPSEDSNGRLVHFFKIWTCWVGRESPLQIVMAVWRLLNLKKVCLTAFSICIWLLHPTSSIVCRRQEGPKSSKDTWRPIH